MENKTREETINLCKAIKNRSLVDVKKALDNGADPELRIDYEEYFIPWKWIYSCDNVSITAYVVIKGNPNTILEEIFGQTAIFGAVLHQNKEMIQVLVISGADINMKDFDGYTPLYLTLGLSKGCMNMIPTLLELGADMTIGAKKLEKAKKKNPETFDYFCKQVMEFLNQSDEDTNCEALRLQIPRILKLSTILPPELIAKSEELKKDYCYDDIFEDDDNSNEAGEPLEYIVEHRDTNL